MSLNVINIPTKVGERLGITLIKDGRRICIYEITDEACTQVRRLLSPDDEIVRVNGRGGFESASQVAKVLRVAPAPAVSLLVRRTDKEHTSSMLSSPSLKSSMKERLMQSS
jgi:hypothetical protein